MWQNVLQKQASIWNCNSFCSIWSGIMACARLVIYDRTCNMHAPRKYIGPAISLSQNACSSYHPVDPSSFLVSELLTRPRSFHSHMLDQVRHIRTEYLKQACCMTDKHRVAPFGKSLCPGYIILVLVAAHVPRIFRYKVKRQMAQLVKFGSDMVSQQLVIQCF